MPSKAFACNEILNLNSHLQEEIRNLTTKGKLDSNLELDSKIRCNLEVKD